MKPVFYLPTTQICIMDMISNVLYNLISSFIWSLGTKLVAVLKKYSLFNNSLIHQFYSILH